jgi:hypothetical protein
MRRTSPHQSRHNWRTSPIGVCIVGERHRAEIRAAGERCSAEIGNTAERCRAEVGAIGERRRPEVGTPREEKALKPNGAIKKRKGEVRRLSGFGR